MEITGVITKIYPKKEGVTKNGRPWIAQWFVIEYEHSELPKSIAFEIYGAEAIRLANLNTIGEAVTVKLNFTAEEYNGRPFNRVTAVSVKRPGKS